MEDTLLKIGKVATGILAAVVIGELTAIGANAAADDGRYLFNKIRQVIVPEPVKPKGFFRRR